MTDSPAATPDAAVPPGATPQPTTWFTRKTTSGSGPAVTRTTSDRYLVISTGSRVTSELRLLDAADPTGDFRIVVPREQGVEYDLDHAVVGGEDRLFVLHNRGAEDFTLGVGAIGLTSLDQLEAVVPPNKGVRLTDIGGMSGRYDAWRETADYLAWIIDTAGAPEQASAGQVEPKTS